MKKSYIFVAILIMVVFVFSFAVSYSDTVIVGGTVSSCATGVASHKIVYNENGGVEVEDDYVSSYLPSDTSLPTTTKDKCSFLGWYYDEVLTKKVEVDSYREIPYTPETDSKGCTKTVTTNLYAKWFCSSSSSVTSCPLGTATHTLVYNTDGGNKLENTVFCSACFHESDELPIPVKADGEFEGWYYDAALTKKVETNKIDEVKYTQEYDENKCMKNTYVNLYAKWSPIVNPPTVECLVGGTGFTIVYNTNGGNKIADYSECRGCGPTTTKLPTPTRKGYEFVGWYYDSKFKKKVNVKYADDVEYTKYYDEYGCPAAKPVNLYAKWKKVTSTTEDKNKEENKDVIEDNVCPEGNLTFKVIYNTNGGKKLDDYVHCSTCAPEVIELPKTIRDSYEFVGWYYDEALTKKVEIDDISKIEYTQEYDENECPKLTIINLYAKWERKEQATTNDNKYTIVYNTDGGNYMYNKTVCTDCDTKTKLGTPKKEGFKFAGWYYDEDYTIKVDAKYLEDLEIGEVLSANSVVNLYAKWEIDTPAKDSNFIIKVLVVIIAVLIILVIIVSIIKKRKAKKSNNDGIEILGL